ncbi:hypothetical protein M3Y97_00779500 [Aphelenchoides bicaudatus]|nr:hypothetical protein M3Y97_00779500 [Aphelenchoides bicaudatus]
MSLWLKTALLVISQLSVHTIAAKECHKSFYIENNDVVEGKLLEHLKDLNLNECAAKCSENKHCNGANFILSLDEQPICILVDSTKNGSLNELPTTSIYSLRSFCQDKRNACQREWAYEKFANYELVNEDFLLGEASNLTLAQCLNSCTRIGTCESLLYNKRTKDCRISKVSINNVNGVRHYLKYSTDFDLYETNCPKRHLDTTHCAFTRINQAGFVDIFDVRLNAVKTLADCESKCLEWHKGICRSYTYNQQSKQCFLSHASQKALGRSVLESLGKDLISGEIDDCFDCKCFMTLKADSTLCFLVKLHCQGKSLKLTGRSMKLFKGSIQSRKNKKIVCSKNVTEDYKFEAEFAFDKCGIEKQAISSPTFAGTLFVKDGHTNLITIHDKVLEVYLNNCLFYVKCQIHNQLTPQNDNLLSFHFEVEDQNATHSLESNNVGSKEQTSVPKYKLEVLDNNQELKNVVDMHETGFLIVDSSDPNDEGFYVTSLIAEDGINKVELINSSGCVTNTSLLTSMERVSKSRFKIGILFEGFPDQSSVTYQSLVKPCKANCELDCNRRFYETNTTFGIEEKFQAKLAQKQKRSIESRKPQRHYTLVDELHRVKRTILTSKINGDPPMSPQEKADLAELLSLLQTSNRQSTTLNQNLLTNVVSSKTQSGNNTIWQCFTEDLSCTFSTLLALFQVLIIFTCTFLVYKYTRKWINYYKNRQEQRPSTFDNFYNYDASFADQNSSSFNSTLQTQTTGTSTTIKH